ncbi:protein-L-isoaspartate(D-aspartate) O-methyltransferase [Nitratireductor aquimarinus]|uniref:protein-L-isoaspartate(D-aspartate) O-methyltransferase n=1 Tax=Nitratireductor TaxID=245876 RepID=UPI0019551C1F|nr:MULTISPECIES: protein-L-isoaspartate(D-aspartate) O-methyltransferase [Nitratireductor]MBN7763542.1 protein-L-isoaspartate(D-aspartate) O-methyltransferase [Nitratireductor aquibiodomus]MBN7774730.1 protein-L-isoaspartate(D-aspartate) O-methyltransferase [Nitratireductor pacificus]MBN7779591.1 protein-L-isoaspartate(D-aspartate) O-methyltransferase [Nitratireductor pacificus]MBN7788398.1 protein-L-isoaspartate(D-aspartate) O-methyltransferase [Nitratireductor aquimarinus]MBY6097117.1 protei
MQTVRRAEMLAVLRRRGIASEAVLDAMAQVPRERFVPDHLAELAYEDGALPIGDGQTISQPYIVALMTEAAELGPESRVLEVGTGSGYSTAILSLLAGHVFSIERHDTLATAARERLETGGYLDNVTLSVGDGTLGLPEKAPFDAIIIAAAGPRVPEALRAQLAMGGRLIMPVGSASGPQKLTCVTRDGEENFRTEDLAPVSFVPLIGAQGWQR